MKADINIAAFYVTCPKPDCMAEIESPNGSLMWDVNEPNPDKVECPRCKTKLTIPAKYLNATA
jgi:hypothetical protein